MIHPEGQVTVQAWDARNLLDTVTRGSGTPEAVTEGYGYDAEGMRTTFTNGRGRVFQTRYDGFGRFKESLDPLNNRSTTAYDDGGNPVAARSFDAGGTLLAHSESEFDLRGRSTKSKAMLWSEANPDARVIETSTVYDPAGNVVSVTAPGSRTTSFGYDAAERSTETTDAMGNVFRSTLDAAGNARTTTLVEQTPDGPIETAMLSTFDALGRPVVQQDPLGNTVQRSYDSRGNVIRSIDPEGHLTVSEYDGLDRMTRAIRPEGILAEYLYDRSSRLLEYHDALGHTTAWSYDALNRKKTTTYPDSTSESIDYDAASNPTLIVDAAGNEIVQGFDDANRLTSKVISLAAGFEGPTTETFAYDGLSRLRSAQSGGVTTNLSYDSLSRLTSETTAGRMVRYLPDDLGNVAAIQYASGLSVDRTHDPLNRLGSVGGVATYGYRGPDLVASRDLVAGPDSELLYDGARRPVEMKVTGIGGQPFGEKLSWSPRGLKVAFERADRGGAGWLVRHDGAGRLLEAAELPEPTALVPNNSLPASGLFGDAVDSFAFGYDAAENMLTRTVESGGVAASVVLPTDDSGRNRPNAIGSTALAWDANGNLIQKGDRVYHYDYRNRLTRITGPGGAEVASYTYDSMNRRIAKTVGGSTEETVWGGWQSLETYRDGTLESRRTYGVGLDEIVRQEVDLNGDGAPETIQTPIYDSTGNLVAIVDAEGRPIERYDYTPFGERTIRADLVQPEIEQVRVVSGDVWFEVTERVAFLRLLDLVTTGELRIENVTTGGLVEIAGVEQPVTLGRQARRRFVLELVGPPALGDQVRLVIPVGALEDEFLNRNTEEIQEEWTWSGLDEVVFDDRPATVAEVRIRQGRVELELTEEVDPQTANTTVMIDGAQTGWELLDDRYTLRSVLGVSPLAHTVQIAPGIEDVAGLANGQALTASFPAGAADRQGYRAPDPTEVPLSLLKNRFAFHGLRADDESGLVYMRNRYYDPELGRFLSDDPNLYMDSGNPGQFALNNPFDRSDPMGLEVLGFASARNWTCNEYSLHDKYGAPSDYSFVERAGDRMVVSVHGYNVDANSAHTWFWKVDFGFKAAGREQPVFGFSWPGDPLGEGWSTPFFALAERNADCAGNTLAVLLGDIRKRGGHGQDLFLMTHSLGARVGLKALTRIAAEQKAPMVQQGYDIDVDGIFMFNAAVPANALSASGELAAALDGARYFGNFYSSDDPVLRDFFPLNQLIVSYGWADQLLKLAIPVLHRRALGTVQLRPRVGARHVDKILDRDMLNSRVSGEPVRDHSEHLDTAKWQFGDTYWKLYETLGIDLNLASRASRER